MDLPRGRSRHRLPPHVSVMGVAVCLKWSLPVADPDQRFAAMSLADQAALESALVDAERRSIPLTVITVGPVGAERVLREGLARGAAHAIRIDTPGHLQSHDVAREIAGRLEGIEHVWCGDYSNDRGSGSVPGFIAAISGRGQALGLVSVSFNEDGSLSASRRLDGGRRESLSISGAAVISVEGSAARLRRATLSRTLAADRATIEVVPSTARALDDGPLRPFRPRARVVAAPNGTALDRVRQVIDTSSGTGHGETVELDPAAAARRIIDVLTEWGYLV